MCKYNLEYSQFLREHPLKSEKDSFKIKYINLLEYIVRKYSSNNAWSVETLKLYKEELLSEKDNYIYNAESVSSILRSVLSTKFKFFKFYTYRYCIIYDIIFMNAPHNKIKAKRIINESIIPNVTIHKKKINVVLESFFGSDINVSSYSGMANHYKLWLSNYNFQGLYQKKILVTANMSAGKSTLINAIVGKKVNKTMNDACTAKVHYIYNKPFEDGYIYELDNQLNLNATANILMEDDKDNLDTEIHVSSKFRSLINQGRICLIDTPGVNSSEHSIHKEITEEFIENEKVDILLYLINGDTIGTYDDLKHLQYVLKNHKSMQIIFVVNKLDKFLPEEDSVEQSLKNVKTQLTKIGFKSPTVFPVSSYFAFLAKSKLYGESLTKRQQMDYEYLIEKFKEREFQFNNYYPKTNIEPSSLDNDNENELALVYSGITHLEAILYN